MDLNLRIRNYKKKGLLSENKRYKDIAESYLEKARNNLVAMQIDYKISVDEGIKKILEIAEFKEYDWVVVKGYYAMYIAVLACLAKIGLKSESHNASISALDFYFVKKGKLEERYLGILKSVSLESEYVEDLKVAKEDRIDAQYEVSEEFQKRKAEEMIDCAKKFVDRLERLFYEIKEEDKKEDGDENEKRDK